MFPDDPTGQGLLGLSPAARAQRIKAMLDEDPNAFSVEDEAQTADAPAAEETPAGDENTQPDDDSLLGDAAASALRGAGQAVNETAGFLAGLVGKEDFNAIPEQWLPEERAGALNGFIEGASQFAVGMVGAGKVLKPLQLGRKAFKAARGLGASKKAAVAVGRSTTPALAGAATDFAAFDPYEERLSNMIEGAPDGFSTPVTRFLSADEDDPELLARAKASIEGMVLGATAEGAIRMIRKLKVNKARKAGQITDEEAAEKIAAVDDEPFENPDHLGIEQWFDEDAPRVVVLKDIENMTPDARPFIEAGIALGKEYSATAGKKVESDWKGILDEFGDQPVRFYHATTSRSGVMDRGLLSRGEAGNPGALGGGGDMVSLTVDPAHAQTIARTLETATRAAKGELTATDILNRMLPSFGDDVDPMDVLPVWQQVEQSNGALDAFMENAGRGLHPMEAEDAFSKEFSRALKERDWNALGTYLDGWLNDADASFWDKDGHFELVRAIDENLPDGRRSFIAVDAAQIAQHNPDDMGVVQVLVRRGAEPKMLNAPERELAFDSKDLEVVERVEARNEARIAAINRQIREKQGGNISHDKIREAATRIQQRLAEGADPRDPGTYADAGLNLDLVIRDYDDFANVARGVEEAIGLGGNSSRPWEDTHARAEDILKAAMGSEAGSRDVAEKVATELFGSTENLDAKIHAAAMTLRVWGQKLAKQAELADQLPDVPEVMDALLNEIDRFANVQVAVLGSRSNIARALNSMKMAGQTPKQAKAAQAAKKEAEEVFKGLTPAQRKALARELRLTNGDPELIKRLLVHTGEIAAKKNREGNWGKIIGFRANMMLSGPTTHAVNAFNNLVTAFEVPLEYWWGGVRSGNAEMRQQGLDMLPTMGAVQDAVKAARVAFNKGMNVLDPTHQIGEGETLVDMSPTSWIGSAAKTILQLPGRALMASDELFKQISYRSHVRSQALRLARRDADNLGLKGAEKNRFLAERVEEQLAGAFSEKGLARNSAALEHARYTSFTNDLEYGIGKWLQDGKNRHPVVGLILPFVRTPVNIVRFAWQRTPLIGKHQRQMKMDLQARGERAAFAKARVEVGWAIYSSAAALAVQGRITGRGPSDPDLNAQWRAAGNQPYSIKLPSGKQVSYRRVEPLASALGIVADAAESWGELSKEEDGANLGYALAAAFSASLTNKTFMTGLSDFFEAMSSGNDWTVKNTMQNFATSFTPNAMKQLNTDPYLRESRTLVESFRARTPGLSDDLEPRRNLFGEKVMKAPVHVGQAFWPFLTMTPPKGAKVAQELVDLGKAMSMPSPTRVEGNVDLRDRKKWDNGTGQSPYDRMFELVANPKSGPNLRTTLEKLIESGAWDRLGEGTDEFVGGGKYEAAKQVVSAYYARAYQQVLTEYPNLRQEVIRLRGVKARGMAAGSLKDQDEALLNP